MNQPLDPNVTTDISARTTDGALASNSLVTSDQATDLARTAGTFTAPDPLVSDLPPIPGYRVVREIARGGMGRVLVAHDLTLDREVALKILLPGANAARFIRESKITAKLPHPGIPPVHAIGTLTDGSPFLAMKLIAGQTLSDEIRRSDRSRLLHAFTQVCQAVGFAHSRGIIHRDLKPSNVMVGAFGEVQVMDWGLAKKCGAGGVESGPEEDDSPMHHSSDASSPSEVTQVGQVLGTPTYMAPEVAAGHSATMASDVYGLGAILHTILLGRPPYTGSTVAEVLKKVMTTEPALFGEAHSSVPPALVAICRRGMARSPADRYPSAEELAQDVRRWLADEPIAIYREPWPARVGRWARRRQTAVVASGVLLLTAAIAASVAAGLVWREQRLTKVQWERAEGEKTKANENADTALTVVRDLSDYVSLVESSEGVTDQRRMSTLDAALTSYERLLALHPADAPLRANVARTHRYRANLNRLLGVLAESEKSYREATRHYRDLASAYPEEPKFRIDLALTSRDFALLVKTLGRLKESAEILDVAIRQFDELWRAEPDKAYTQRSLAIVHLDRAELDYQLGNYADTERHARRSMDLYIQMADKAATKVELLDPLFRGMAEIRLAIALRELGKIDDALVVHNQVVDRFATLGKVTTSRDNMHESYRALAERGMTLIRVPGRQASAIADLDAAIGGVEKLVKQFPQVPAYLRSQGTWALFRARVKASLGQRDGAIQDLNAAIKIFEGLVGKQPNTPVYRSFLGQAYLARGQLDTDSQTAHDWYGKAHEMLEGAVKRSPENIHDQRFLAEVDALRKFSKP